MRSKAELREIDCRPLGENVIAKMEEVLEMARSGQISAVGLAFVHRDGSTGTTWSEAPSIATLIGAVARLQHRLVTHGDE